MAVIERDAHAVVEREAATQRVAIGALHAQRGDQQPHAVAAGVEAAVAEILLVVEAMVPRDAIELALQMVEGAERRLLTIGRRLAELRDAAREVHQVVEQTAALTPGSTTHGLMKSSGRSVGDR